jgi:type VI secretion system secreted protein VgrG
VGQLHNGEDEPPFAAGEDSGVNHLGVISGIHTRTLDDAHYSQWVVDDATGQLRMRLLCSYSAAEVGLGHLIQQRATSAQRGAWRGTGFELATHAWASVRAASGLLITTEHRPATYGSAEGGQMDAQGAVSLLQGARDLGQRLASVAHTAGAQGLDTHGEGQAEDHLIAQVDPARQSHTNSNGQTAPAFAEPLMMLHTPSTAAFATETSIASHSGQHLSVVSQGDVQHTARHTHATVAGRTASLYTHGGCITAHAAHGDVSLRAHADELQILADREVQVMSVDGEIRIQAAQRIDIVGGESSIVLDGGDITFTCPGTFAVHGSGHAFEGGAAEPASFEALPSGQTANNWIETSLKGYGGQYMSGIGYELTFADGSKRTGTLNGSGEERQQAIPWGQASVVYKNRPGAKDLEVAGWHQALSLTEQLISAEEASVSSLSSAPVGGA